MVRKGYCNSSFLQRRVQCDFLGRVEKVVSFVIPYPPSIIGHVYVVYVR